MWGYTQERMVNGLLDDNAQLRAEHDNATQAILDYMRSHPEADGDPDLILALMALL